MNRDSTTSQTTNNPDSWAAPKDADGDGHIKFQSDDIYPERKLRLGQYLSDYSSGNISGPNNDNSNFRGSHFPIENPTPTEYERLSNPATSYTDLLEEGAQYYFDNLAKGTSFVAGVGDHEGGALENSPRVQDGHTILRDGASIVDAHLEYASANPSSRWAGIGAERFNPASNPGRYQVNRAGASLDGSQVGDTSGSRFRSFEHVNGSTNSETITDPDFWENYFASMSQVGARITLAAQGYRNPEDAADLSAKGSVAGGGAIAGAPAGLDSLQGNYKRVSLSGMQPSNVFDANEEFSEMGMSEAQTLSGKSWGQLYSWAAPYDSAAGIGSNRAMAVASQLVEIWAMVQLRVLVITSIFQAASMLLSTISTPPLFGRKDGLNIPWNRNYYPDNVQKQPGTAFTAGQSGFNHSPVDIIEKALEELNGLSSRIDNYAGFLIPQIAGGAINQAGKILEGEFLNFTRSVLKEVNVYIPRHTLSTSANVSGYNEDGGFGNFLLKGLDVATAYNRATAAGLGSLSMHIIGGDRGQSLGFWRNLFREVVRSKAALQEVEIHSSTSGYESILRYVGKDDKIMKFVNYLAMLGDMDIGRGFAGKLAFPENKVELKSVSNFPTLRTAANRKKGGAFDKVYQSRLSLTETPSLYLMPKSIRNIRLGLEDTGVQKMGGAWGNFSGINELHNKKISDEDAAANTSADQPINERWQARPENRFSADQVRRIEDQLEAEHMPFYIHDLRTNEIISFHAFLTSLSDSYTGDWSAQKGFGRLEAAQIYGGGSRSIGVSFSMIPMNEEDFDEMYVKINKLTTMVYPQWSQGTKITTGEGTFVQPFSQVPTASPLCRIRVGDLFTSNYSKSNMARMMGVGNPDFSYGDADIRRDNSIPVPNSGERRRIKRRFLRRFIRSESLDNRREIMEKFNDNPDEFELSQEEGTGMVFLQMPGIIPRLLEWRVFDEARYFWMSTEISAAAEPSISIPLGGSAESGAAISDLFSNSNPIFKSFESTMGRGIAVAVTGITFDWKLNSVPWELKAGSRAPRMCDVQLSIVPIHDITPGIDHEGFNRAPIYRVGDTMRSVGGDVWYDNAEYKKLTADIENQHQSALEGREPEE